MTPGLPEAWTAQQVFNGPLFEFLCFLAAAAAGFGDSHRRAADIDKNLCVTDRPLYRRLHLVEASRSDRGRGARDSFVIQAGVNRRAESFSRR